MKRAVLLTILVLTGITAAGVSAQRRPLPPTGGIEKVRDNLYKIPGAGGNTVVFVRDDGVVLVDTKLPNNGQAILDQVRTVTDKPVSMVINTHSHPDHIGSNDFFTSRRPTVEVVAQRNTGVRMAAPTSKPSRAPNRTFSDRMTLGTGKDRIDLYYFGPGHTNGDAFVVFPSARAMATGDIMAWYMAPLIDPASGGSVLALPFTLTRAQDTIKGVDLVIEGHGNVNSWQGFRSYTSFNRALRMIAEQTLKRGGTPEEALAELQRHPTFAVFLGDEVLKGMEYGGTPKSRALININVAFQELKGEPVTTNWGPRPPGGRPAPGAPAAPSTRPRAPRGT